MDNLILNVENIRAISKASIKFDGITVVSGVNGCGKTTLSRLMYATIKSSKNFEKISKDYLILEFRDIIRAVVELLSELSRKDENHNKYISSRNLYFELIREKDIDKIKQRLLSYIDEIQININKHSANGNDKLFSRVNYRIERIIRNILDEGIVKLTDDDDISSLLDNLKERINNAFEKALLQIQERSIVLFNRKFRDYFPEGIEKRFQLFEFGAPIADWDNNKLLVMHWIQDCVYIDTPMSLNRSDDNEYWDELDDYLKDDSTQSSLYHSNLFDSLFDDGFESKRKESINLINKIIAGEAIYDSESVDDSFVYRRKDGSDFDLTECATGIKAFAIIQMLLKNGHINRDTLIIIDEPEAHLHPQWIVEYARMIVLLHKNLGVKFLIATHNPDMVSAIKYIAQKENAHNGLNYYLAKQDKQKFLYHYKHLGLNIDKIFESFNVALEKISKYGVD